SKILSICLDNIFYLLYKFFIKKRLNYFILWIISFYSQSWF
ncbi:hypothetical protein GUU_00115, partial [Malacoplasma iowae 695]